MEEEIWMEKLQVLKSNENHGFSTIKTLTFTQILGLPLRKDTNTSRSQNNHSTVQIINQIIFLNFYKNYSLRSSMSKGVIIWPANR